MAVAGIKVVTDFPELEKLRTALGNVFGKKEMAAVLSQSLERAIEPAYLRLREITPRGPTGNLLRAVNRKVKAYPRDGNAVGLIGYNRSGKGDADSAQGGTVQVGPDRAFHQWWLEYGTKPRMVAKFSNKPYQRKSKLGNIHWVSGQNAFIASSFNKLGPFKIQRNKSRASEEFKTDPPYQKAFFKKSASPIRIPAMRPGGLGGRPPVRVAWEQSQSQVASILEQELGNVLNQAVQKLPVSKEGTLSG
jgi:hypothetical protein